MSMVVPNFAAIMDMPAGRIRLHAHAVGGGFGIRSQAYPEYCAVMHAAKMLGKPVKWVGSRFETIVSDHHGRAAELTGQLPLDRDGRFIGLRLDWVCNSGPSPSPPRPPPHTLTPPPPPITPHYT